MELIHKYIPRGIKYLLILTAFMPLFVSRNTYFPYVVGKLFYVRALIELAFVFCLGYFIYLLIRPSESQTLSRIVNRFRELVVHPVFIAVSAFVFSYGVSTLFAINSYRAWWGDLERGDGFFGLLHYFVFLILTFIFFEKRDWIIFLRSSLITGLIVIFYAILQFFGVEQFIIAISKAVRSESLIGNAAFLSTHMFFVIAFAWALLREDVNRLWKYIAWISILGAILTMFLTGTRGAILGLLGGGVVMLFIFLFRKETIYFKSFSLKKISGGLLLFLMVFGLVFWNTRHIEFWQSIPGLNRLARTAILDTADASTQTRLGTWALSFEAFKAHPIIGWGPENYLLAYEKYYNPTLSAYGETWLDRAHNKVIDLLVAQGIVGLVAYGVLLFVLVRMLFRTKNKLAILGIWFSVAYVLQNLVLFDQLLSYATFFALLGFFIFSSQSKDQNNVNFVNDEVPQQRLAVKAVVAGIGGVLGVAALWSLYAYNFIPYVQARAVYESPRLGQINLVVEKLKEGFYPYNFAQFTIRGQVIDSVYLDNYFYNDAYRTKESFKSLGVLLLQGIQEIVDREPYDVRMIIREVEMLDAMARDDEKLYPKIESLIRKALTFAPKRQELLYHLAVNLAKQERFNEAISIAREAVALASGVPRSHFHLGLVLSAYGKKDEALAEFEKAEMLDPAFGIFQPSDRQTLLRLYATFNRYDKIAEIILRSAEGKAVNFDTEFYRVALDYFRKNREADKFIAVATYLANHFPDLKDDMETLIDLVKRGNWSIIDKLE